MSCDLILLHGNTIMNESVLTGESVPVMKSQLPFNDLKFENNTQERPYVLLAGTTCIETKYACCPFLPSLSEFFLCHLVPAKKKIP